MNLIKIGKPPQNGTQCKSTNDGLSAGLVTEIPFQIVSLRVNREVQDAGLEQHNEHRPVVRLRPQGFLAQRL